MAKARYLLGFDIGSSSIKATLLDVEKGTTIAAAVSPETELAIMARKPGWAEQDPEEWWRHVVIAARAIGRKTGSLDSVAAIGIAYQMHGLVLVDKAQKPLRPSIIWCDGRAVEIGERAFQKIGADSCLQRLLNSPGNFTAAKLAWVKENEPEIYRRVHKAMLPGDYIAMKMTGEIKTTVSGLSEGIFWDFKDGKISDTVLDTLGISGDLLADIAPTFSVQGSLGDSAAAELGLKKGVVVAYRAGDQPNNAFSLNVLNPGEAATTAGTSGVVYGVASQPRYDRKSRVNTFVHVNHSAASPRFGILLCLNGTGILNSWIRRNFMGSSASYEEMNGIAAKAPVGSDGLLVMPYGNGAERTLENRNAGSMMLGLDFNRHGLPHVLRAAQEGIVFALRYGLSIMADMGMDARTVRAGHANMFLSPIFSEAFASATGARVELFNTDGSQGAARGAGLGAGIYKDPRAAFVGLAAVRAVDPDPKLVPAYAEAYGKWEEALKKVLA
jgi:xylulokinase